MSSAWLACSEASVRARERLRLLALCWSASARAAHSNLNGDLFKVQGPEGPGIQPNPAISFTGAVLSWPLVYFNITVLSENFPAKEQGVSMGY